MRKAALLIAVMSLGALAFWALPESKVERCQEVYAGTLGYDGCRSEEQNLRKDGQLKDRDWHCRLWTAYHEKTGRCRDWKDEESSAGEDERMSESTDTGPAATSWSDAWIWVAIGSAQGGKSGPVPIEHVVGSADYVNRAIPSYEEFRHGVERLVDANMATAGERGIALTGRGLAEYESVVEPGSSLYDAIGKLESKLPADATDPKKWELTTKEYEAAVARNSDQFRASY